jgi:hypothetical protein
MLFQNVQPKILQIWEEVVGVLLQIAARGEGNVMVNVSGAEYVFKNFPKELLEKLKAHRNCLIGILRTDAGYAIRVIHSKMRVQACQRRVEHG